jgi:hypothetical protein
VTTTTIERTALYRLFDADDTLLYVGITVDPETRWWNHAKEKSWWPEVANRTVEWFDNRAAAEAAEFTAIVTEDPRYNVEHSTTRKRGDAKTEYQSPYDKPRRMRAPLDEWAGLGAATKAMGVTRAAAVREFMRWYMRRPGAKLPDRPPTGPWSHSRYACGAPNYSDRCELPAGHEGRHKDGNMSWPQGVKRPVSPAARKERSA